MSSLDSRMIVASALAFACAGAQEPAPAPAPAPAPEPAAAPLPPAEIAIATLPASQNAIVTLRLMFRAGSADDPAGLEGVTALAAQLMAEGGTEKLGAHELEETLFPWAVDIDVQVDAEMTVFATRVHKDHLGELMPILADVLLHPRWDPSEFERIRRDRVDGIDKGLRASDDENLGKEALGLALFAGHPYGHYVGGAIEPLEALTVEQVKDHARRVFNKRRLTLGFAGGWPEDLPGRLRAALDALPDGPAPLVIPAAPSDKDGVRLFIVEKDAPAVAVSMGFPVAFSRRDGDFHKIMVGMSAFGEHRQFHGRLMRKLREERGLNYGDYAYAEHFEQDGWSTFPLTNIGRSQQYFSMWLRPVQPENALFAVRAALYEYTKLLNQGLGAEEIATTKGFLSGYTKLWEKNDDRRLGYLLDDLYYATPARLERFREALPAMTAEDVSAALKKNLKPIGELRIVVVTKDAAGFRDAVLANTASPMTYNTEKDAALLEEDKVIQTFAFGLRPEQIRITKVEELFQHGGAGPALSEIAPTPYTAEQIRAATPQGRRVRFRVAATGAPVVFRQFQFDTVGPEGSSGRVSLYDASGALVGEPKVEQSTWAELVQHAAYPRADTTISDASVDTVFGKIECSLYTVSSPEGVVTRAYFPKRLPGPPVLMLVSKGDAEVLRMEMVEHDPRP